MSEYEVGYKKPPRATQFKPGTSGNPKGRPKRVRSPLNEILEDVLDAVVKYRENGKVRTATRREVSLKLLVRQAIKGDVGAADIVRRKRVDALRQAGPGSTQLEVRDWLPDFPGETAEQKVQGLKVSEPILNTDDPRPGPGETAPPEKDEREADLNGAIPEGGQ